MHTNINKTGISASACNLGTLLTQNLRFLVCETGIIVTAVRSVSVTSSDVCLVLTSNLHIVGAQLLHKWEPPYQSKWLRL